MLNLTTFVAGCVIRHCRISTLANALRRSTGIRRHASNGWPVLNSMEMPESQYKRILCVGDVHECWDAGDESAVKAMQPDVLLFVGDYGDEAVGVVERIVKFANALQQSGSCYVAIAIGNHEALLHGFNPQLCQNISDNNPVVTQLRMVEPFNPSYRSTRIPTLQRVSLVGGRPFSWGGPSLEPYEHIFETFLSLKSVKESAKRIYTAVENTPSENAIVFLSHNGPFGLGDARSDPCGMDYKLEAKLEDRGDVDLRQAVAFAREKRHRVPLVVFGHFHNKLFAGQGDRTMVVSEQDGTQSEAARTVMLNAAFVPRHRVAAGKKLRHFMNVLLSASHDVTLVEEIWVTSSGDVCERTTHYTHPIDQNR